MGLMIKNKWTSEEGNSGREPEPPTKVTATVYLLGRSLFGAYFLCKCFTWRYESTMNYHKTHVLTQEFEIHCPVKSPALAFTQKDSLECNTSLVHKWYKASRLSVGKLFEISRNHLLLGMSKKSPKRILTWAVR